MKLTIPLQAGTTLANVRYYWIVAGVKQSVQSTGISQPDATFSLFEFDVTPPSGADEIVAYDATDVSNWNVGQYKIAALNVSVGQISPDSGLAPVPTGTLITAPLVTFKSVYEGILRRLGYNPRGDRIKEDVAFNVLQHINDRVSFAWGIWDWPQTNVMQWRAFRTIWTPTLIFKLGEDLYYFGDGVSVTARTLDPPIPGANAGYYHCIVNAPQGTLPTNPVYFEPLAITDRYIAYQQRNEEAIGEVLDAYKKNPRQRHRTMVLHSAPSSKGIDVRTHQDLVWIRYRLPVPQYTLLPFRPGVTVAGTPFYDPIGGNCITYAFDINGVHTGTLIPFPAFLAGYIKPAAYADTLLETAMEAKTKLLLAQAAQEEALEYLQHQIDLLAAQGQRLYYSAFPHRRRQHQTDIAVGAIPSEQFAGYS